MQHVLDTISELRRVGQDYLATADKLEGWLARPQLVPPPARPPEEVRPGDPETRRPGPGKRAARPAQPQAPAGGAYGEPPIHGAIRAALPAMPAEFTREDLQDVIGRGAPDLLKRNLQSGGFAAALTVLRERGVIALVKRGENGSPTLYRRGP